MRPRARASEHRWRAGAEERSDPRASHRHGAERVGIGVVAARELHQQERVAAGLSKNLLGTSANLVTGAATGVTPAVPVLPFGASPSPGNIVPDFPVINKSFNLSYSGNDR